MQQYNIFQAILMSFYSGELYRDVATKWGGKAFLYLFVLLVLAWIPYTYLAQVAINQSYRGVAHKLMTQVPVLTIKDGKVSTPENRAYVIVNPSTNERVAVIDTTGQTTTLEQAQTKVLVTNTEIITQTDPNEIKSNNLPHSLNMVVKPQSINAFLENFISYLWIVIFIFVLVLSFIYRIMQALLYGIIGKIFSAMVRANLSYGQIMQIAMIAVTPAIVLATILDFFYISFPLQSLCYFLLTMFYLFYGIIANKRAKALPAVIEK